MNNMAKTAALLAALAVVASFAQEGSGIKFGIRAGLNLASFGINDDYDETNGPYSYSRTSDGTSLTGNLIGFHAGAVVDVELLEFLYFQPGLMFSLKGQDTESEYKRIGPGNSSIETSKLSTTAYYIDVPLNLSLKGKLSNDLALRAHVGPYIGFGLFGEMEMEYKDSEYPEDNESRKVKLFSKEKDVVCEYDYDSGDDVCSVREVALFDRFNFGISFGVGIEYSDFYLGVSYNYGLTSLASEDAEKMFGKIYERTLGITLGYNF